MNNEKNNKWKRKKNKKGTRDELDREMESRVNSVSTVLMRDLVSPSHFLICHTSLRATDPQSVLSIE